MVWKDWLALGAASLPAGEAPDEHTENKRVVSTGVRPPAIRLFRQAVRSWEWPGGRAVDPCAHHTHPGQSRLLSSAPQASFKRWPWGHLGPSGRNMGPARVPQSSKRPSAHVTAPGGAAGVPAGAGGGAALLLRAWFPTMWVQHWARFCRRAWHCGWCHGTCPWLRGFPPRPLWTVRTELRPRWPAWASCALPSRAGASTSLIAAFSPAKTVPFQELCSLWGRHGGPKDVHDLTPTTWEYGAYRSEGTRYTRCTW